RQCSSAHSRSRSPPSLHPGAGPRDTRRRPGRRHSPQLLALEATRRMEERKHASVGALGKGSVHLSTLSGRIPRIARLRVGRRSYLRSGLTSVVPVENVSPVPPVGASLAATLPQRQLWEHAARGLPSTASKTGIAAGSGFFRSGKSHGGSTASPCRSKHRM